MTNQQWKIAASVLGITFALLAGGALASVLIPGSPKASASPSDVAVGSPSFFSESPSASVSPSATASASPSGSPSASPSPSATARPIPIAGLTLVNLKLDATQDPAGHNRALVFTSDGAGPVMAKLVSHTPQGTTHLCVKAGTKDLGCRNWANGTFKAQALSGKVKWTITLRGQQIATPVVDIAVSFPARKPSVKVSRMRFDGTSFPDTNGITAVFVPRAKGNVALAANWGGHNFVYAVELTNQTSGSGNVNLPNQPPATSTAMTLPVTANETWQLVLRNAETGFGPTTLTATITWP
jgi:hypothetical protein